MSLSSRSRLSLALPALALVFAAACSPAASVPTAAPATAGPSVAAVASQAAPRRTPYQVDVPAALQGRWTSTVTSTRVTNGLWKMQITENEIIVRNPKGGVGDAFELGVLDITADHITFWDDPECLPVGLDTEGTYTYTFDGEQLVFTEIDDSCGDRRALLVDAPWEPLS